jgi:hypothetical protein
MPLAYSAPTTLPALVPATTAGEAVGFQHLDHADVGEALGRAAAQRDADLEAWPWSPGSWSRFPLTRLLCWLLVCCTRWC